MKRRGRKLGEILVSQGFVSEENLQIAMDIQIKTGKSISATLIEAKLVSADDIHSIVGEQININSKKKLGELLVEKGFMTNAQVDQALARQKETHKKLGTCIVELGFVTESNIIDLLSAQLDVPRINLEFLKLSSSLITAIPEKVCKEYHILPIYEYSGVINIAMADPTNLKIMDSIKFQTGKAIEPAIASEKDIMSAIERLYHNAKQEMRDLLSEAGEGDELEIVADEEDDSELTDDEGKKVVQVVNKIIHDAINEDASDIHLEPTDKGFDLRYRVDGEMKIISQLPLNMRPQIISRLKIQAQMDIAEKRKPQDGRIKLKHEGRNVDLRVSTFPAMTRQQLSEKVVMRIIDAEGKNFTLKQLGLSEDTLKKFEELISIPDGIILVTGPTGSGKSSTLYASLAYVNAHYENKKTIITMEDPVESSVEGITQGQINVKAGFTFAAGMRAILRQDPDIIMIGEMRDLETSEMAVQAALTGHLVFSTLHTNDSCSAYTRLADMGVASYLTSSTVRGIMAQRLTRRLCGNCKEEYTPEAHVMEKIGMQAGLKMWRSVGCAKCKGSGYRGRLGLYELLLPDREVEKLVVKKVEASEIKEYLVGRGDFITLRMDGLIKAHAGETSIEQIMGATQEAH